MEASFEFDKAGTKFADPWDVLDALGDFVPAHFAAARIAQHPRYAVALQFGAFGAGLEAEAEWIEAYRKLFEARFDALDEIITELKQEKSNGVAR